MPARVFSALLVTDSGRLTAAELGELLGASPAAISGAVRYLEQVGMIGRQREPGSRRDVYLLRNDLWYEISLGRDQLLAHWANAARDGAEILGPDTPAGRRLADSHDFFVFLRQELPCPAGALAGPQGRARLAPDSRGLGCPTASKPSPRSASSPALWTQQPRRAPENLPRRVDPAATRSKHQ
jgi:hypothetical protein